MTSAADFGLAGAAFHHPPMLTAAVETPRYRGISSAGFEPLHLRIEFAKTLSSGREKSNMRISSKAVLPPPCQRKSQAMQIPHTETSSYLRNLAVPRGF